MITLTLLFAVASAHAGSQVYSLPQCHETVQTGAWWPDLDCAAAEYKKADARLNRLWKVAFKSNDAQQKRKLLAEERDWISRLGAICGSVTDLSGERDFIEYRKLACRYKLTQERARYLSAFIQRWPR